MTRWIYTTAATFLAVLLVTTPGQIYGQNTWSIKHLRKTNPDALFFYFEEFGECPGTRESYETIIEGELLRASIKREPEGTTNELVLEVHLRCLIPIAREVVAWRLQVIFGIYRDVVNPAPDEFAYIRTLYLPGYGALGLASYGRVNDQLRINIRKSVSDALIDYLKANQTP